MARIVTVFGATGTQGSAVVNTLVADGTFAVRAITRNVDSDAAKKLKARGVDVVRANIGDKESIKQAIAGSEGVYGVTQPYDPAAVNSGDPDIEIQLGKNLVDASKEVGVKFFIWSSLPTPRIISNGKFTGARYLDNKVVVDDYLRKSGLPHAILQTGYFVENSFNLDHLIRTPEGLEIVVTRFPPNVPLVMLWVNRDLGPAVLALLKNYTEPTKEILGQTFVAATERITYGEFAGLIQEGTGKPVKYNPVATSGVPETDGMWDFFSEFDLFSGRPIPDPRLLALGVESHKLKDFAKEVLAVHPNFA